MLRTLSDADWAQGGPAVVHAAGVQGAAEAQAQHPGLQRRCRRHRAGEAQAILPSAQPISLGALWPGYFVGASVHPGDVAVHLCMLSIALSFLTLLHDHA